MISSPARQAERRLANVPCQVDLDGHGLAGDQFREPAELVHHGLQLAQHSPRLILPAAGNAHRQRRIRGRGPQRRLYQRGEKGGTRYPQEISAIATRSHGSSPSIVKRLCQTRLKRAYAQPKQATALATQHHHDLWLWPH